VVGTGSVVATQPAPATGLQATYRGSTAVLTWLASPSGGVAGYRVYKDGDTATYVGTASGPYLDIEQGYDSTASYQVKPYMTGSDLGLTLFATVAVGQAVDNYAGTPWARVTIPAELFFTLKVMNNVKSNTDALITLKYLGPAGNSSAVTIGSPQTIPYSATVYGAHWENLKAGVYQFGWETTNNWTGSRLVTLTAPQEIYLEKCIP
jgi:hypothetical protein